MPLIIGSTLANVFNWTEDVFVIISPFKYIPILYDIMTTEYNSYVYLLLLGMGIYFFAAVVLFKWSTKKITGNYL